MEHKTEQHRKYWSYGLFSVAAVLIALCVQLGRMDFLLRRYCKDALHPSLLGQEGLYALFLLTAGFILYTLWLFLTDRQPKKRQLAASLAVFLLCAALTSGYCSYHSSVLAASTNQSRYQKVYDKGLLYDLSRLTK